MFKLSVFSCRALVFEDAEAVSVRQLLHLEQTHNTVYKAVCCKYKTSCNRKSLQILSLNNAKDAKNDKFLFVTFLSLIYQLQKGYELYA
jgi:hypothetical protein